MTEATMLAELKSERDELSSRISEIERVKRDAENTAFVGKCFRYRNCYSCPDGDEDYWWLYIRVTAAEDGWLVLFEFETDKNGQIEIRPPGTRTHMSLSGHEEIPYRQYIKAWRELVARIKDF